jgi:hypothetical protein
MGWMFSAIKQAVMDELGSMKTEHPKHDGSACPEGTRRVPARFKACCEVFEGHTTACYLDIRDEWWSKQRTWVTVIPAAAGGGGITINLLSSLREAAPRRST